MPPFAGGIRFPITFLKNLPSPQESAPYPPPTRFRRSARVTLASKRSLHRNSGNSHGAHQKKIIPRLHRAQQSQRQGAFQPECSQARPLF